MDILSVSLLKSNAEIKGFKSPPSINNGNDNNEKEEGDMEEKEDKSLLTMKKIYSTDRIAFDLSLNKLESFSKCMDKPFKTSKLFRTSSSNTDKDQFYYAANDLSKLSFLGENRFLRSTNDMFLMDILYMKKYALTLYIQENPKSADLRWSLFCAACHSYRYDSVLRPFPPMFLVDDVKDIDKLRDVAESCPSINVLFEIMQSKSPTISTDLINLLYWVLIHVREPQLIFVPKDKHSSILTKVMSTTDSAAPQYIFQVTDKVTEEEKFNELAKNYNVIYAFHGSRLDNFYSILNYGLRISFNKISAYGPGIYLSSEMNISLPYSRTGFSWGGSYFGSQISIVALCEMIDHPDVKYSNDAAPKKKFTTDMKLVPEKYFIVQNSDLVRVKYLLIYGNTNPQLESSYHLSTVMTWFQKNKVVAVVIAYVILLMAIATSNSSTLYKFYKRMIRRLGLKL